MRGAGEIVDPQPSCLPELNGAGQHGIERPEERQLQQVGQTSAEWVYALTLVKLLQLAILICLAGIGELVAFVLVVDGRDLRLQLLHPHGRLWSRCAAAIEPR